MLGPGPASRPSSRTRGTRTKTTSRRSKLNVSASGSMTDEASFVTGHALVVDGGYTAGHRFGIGKLMGLDDD